MDDEESQKIAGEEEMVERIENLLTSSYCSNCQALKQELEKVQAEQSLNYTTLKEKIISTDLLIKKYTSKCQEYDAISKKTEELTKKLDQYKKDCELLEDRLKSTLKEYEPLKQEKIQLAARYEVREGQNRSLREKLEASEASSRIYLQAQAKHEQKIKDYEGQLQQNKQKVKDLEQNTRKQDALIKKLQADLAAKKIDLSEQKKLTSKIITIKDKAEEKSHHYEEVLRTNGLFQKAIQSASRGLRRKIQNDQRHVHVKQEVSSDEDFLLEKLFKDEDSETEDMCLFRPIGNALSPLPPSPPSVEEDDSCSDEESIVELADALEHELLGQGPGDKKTRSVKKMPRQRGRSRGSGKGHARGTARNSNKDKLSEEQRKPTRLVESGLSSEGVLTLQESLSDPEVEQVDDGTMPFQFANNKILQNDLSQSASSTSGSESDSTERSARRRSPRNLKKTSQSAKEDDVPRERRRTRSMSQDSGSESDSTKAPTPLKSTRGERLAAKESIQNESPFKAPLPVSPRRSRRISSGSKTDPDAPSIRVAEPKRVTRSHLGSDNTPKSEMTLAGKAPLAAEKQPHGGESKNVNESINADNSSDTTPHRPTPTKKRRREVDEDREEGGSLEVEPSPKSKSPRMETLAKGSEKDVAQNGTSPVVSDSKPEVLEGAISSFLEDLQNAFKKSPLAVYKRANESKPTAKSPQIDSNLAQSKGESGDEQKSQEGSKEEAKPSRRKMLTTMKGITPLCIDGSTLSSQQENKQDSAPQPRKADDEDGSSVSPPSGNTLEVANNLDVARRSPEHRPLSKTSSTGFILRTLEEDLTDMSTNREPDGGSPFETDGKMDIDTSEAGRGTFTLGSPQKSHENSSNDVQIVGNEDKGRSEFEVGDGTSRDDGRSSQTESKNVDIIQVKEGHDFKNESTESLNKVNINESGKNQDTASHHERTPSHEQIPNSFIQPSGGGDGAEIMKLDSPEKVVCEEVHKPEECTPIAEATNGASVAAAESRKPILINKTEKQLEVQSIEKVNAREKDEIEATDDGQDAESASISANDLSNSRQVTCPKNYLDEDEDISSKSSSSPCPSEGEDNQNPSINTSSKNRAMLKRQFSVDSGNRAGELSTKGTSLRNKFVGATKMPSSPASATDIPLQSESLPNASNAENEGENSEGKISKSPSSKELTFVPKIIVSNTDSNLDNIDGDTGAGRENIEVNVAENDDKISVIDKFTSERDRDPDSDEILPSGECPEVPSEEDPEKHHVLPEPKEENDDNVSHGNVSVVCQFDEESIQSLPSLSGSDSGSAKSQAPCPRPSFLPIHQSFDSNSNSDSRVGTPESQQLSASTPQDAEDMSLIEGESSVRSVTPTNITSPPTMGESNSPMSPLPPSPMNKTENMTPLSPFPTSDQSEALSPLSFTFSDTEDIGNPISPLPPSPVPFHRQHSQSPDIEDNSTVDNTSLGSAKSPPSSPYLCPINDPDTLAGPSTSVSEEPSPPPPVHQPKARIAHRIVNKEKTKESTLVTAKGKATPGIPAKSSKKKTYRSDNNQNDSAHVSTSPVEGDGVDGESETKDDVSDSHSVSSVGSSLSQGRASPLPVPRKRGRPPKRKTADRSAVPNKIQCKSANLHRTVVTKESAVSQKSLEKEIMQLIRKRNISSENVASHIAKLYPSGYKKPIVDALLKACMSQELDLLSSLYTKCCKTANVNRWEPFLADHELAVLSLILGLDKTNLFKGIVQLFLAAASYVILEKSMTSVLVRVSLCRLCTALCRQKGDVNQMRVLLYDVIESQVPGFTTLTLGVACVWPGLLCRTLAQGPQKLIESMEHVVMKRVSGEKVRLTKLATCLKALCQWAPPEEGKDATWIVKDTLEYLKVELDKAKPGQDVVYELEQSLILLGSTEEWSWTNNVMTVEVMWPQLQAWCMEQMGRLQSGVSTRLAESLIRVTGYVMSRCPATQSSSAEDIIKTTSHLVYGVPGAKIPEAIQRTALEALLRLAPFNPKAVAGAACHWVSSRSAGRKLSKDPSDGVEASLLKNVRAFRDCYTNILLGEDLEGLMHV